MFNLINSQDRYDALIDINSYHEGKKQRVAFGGNLLNRHLGIH